jgi:predicted metal-dependent hydrolase
MVGTNSIRCMLYLKNGTFTPKDADLLLSKARSVLSGQDVIIRDARVSSEHIEYDISFAITEDLLMIESKLCDIGNLIGVYQVVEKEYEKNQALPLAMKFFNEEKYWIAHEILEGVWKKSEGKEKQLLNGLILVAAAFVHYQKNESKIALSIMTRALEKLRLANGNYFQINVDSLKQEIGRILKSNTICIIKL